MRNLLAVVAVLALGQSASAQTTHCQWIANIWTCSSTPPVSLNTQVPYDFSINVPDAGQAFLQSYQQAQQQRQQTRDRQVAESVARAQAEINQERLNLAAEVRRNVGKLLADKDCDGAKNLALSSGDIALANEVKAYCATP